MPAILNKFNVPNLTLCEVDPNGLPSPEGYKIVGPKKVTYHSRDLNSRMILDFIAFKPEIGAQYHVTFQTKTWYGRWSTVDRYEHAIVTEGLNQNLVIDLSENPLL